MSGIPHFEDLSARKIYESLDLEWLVSEKLDGSSLRFGLDESGRFYVNRKGGEPCYDVTDWPDECWAASYKIAHSVAALLVEALIKNDLIAAGQNISAEVIHGRQPNTITYEYDLAYHGIMVITGLSYEVRSKKEMSLLLAPFVANLKPTIRVSQDGLVDHVGPVEQCWAVIANNVQNSHYIKVKLGKHASKLKRVLDDWFPRESKVEGFTIEEVLNINLSRKHPKAEGRDWNVLKTALKGEREELREVFTSMVLLFKEVACKVLINESSNVIGAGYLKEGVVVAHGDTMFKFVEREVFTQANRFTHIVKYWLVGGRRPVRPCFLGRTKDWPKEERLKRLEVLRKRYLNNHYTMHYSCFASGYKLQTLFYSGDLHRRTLGLFSDTKKRIENGR